MNNQSVCISFNVWPAVVIMLTVLNIKPVCQLVILILYIWFRLMFGIFISMSLIEWVYAWFMDTTGLVSNNRLCFTRKIKCFLHLLSYKVVQLNTENSNILNGYVLNEHGDVNNEKFFCKNFIRWLLNPYPANTESV